MIIGVPDKIIVVQSLHFYGCLLKFQKSVPSTKSLSLSYSKELSRIQSLLFLSNFQSFSTELSWKIFMIFIENHEREFLSQQTKGSADN